MTFLDQHDWPPSPGQSIGPWQSILDRSRRHTRAADQFSFEWFGNHTWVATVL